MTKISVSQIIGAQGLRYVQHQVAHSADWIVRGQEEDFGIDSEIELAEGEVKGQILKLQIKTSQSIKLINEQIKYRIPTSLVHYADNCRIPVVLVIVSIQPETAWYIWLQKWIVELRQSGRSIEDLGKSVTLCIPNCQTLDIGLKNDLKNIARWKTETQLILSLADTIRTAVVVRSQEVMVALSKLIETVDITYQEYPVEIIVDEVLNLGLQIWATPEGNKVSDMLYRFCRNHGNLFTAKQIYRLVVRDSTVSRTGINALGILYDEFAPHIEKLKLPKVFKDLEDPRALYYCKLRERYPGETLTGIVLSGKEMSIDNLAFYRDDNFLDKWANRGDSVFLDYVYIQSD